MHFWLFLVNENDGIKCDGLNHCATKGSAAGQSWDRGEENKKAQILANQRQKPNPDNILAIEKRPRIAQKVEENLPIFRGRKKNIARIVSAEDGWMVA